MVTKITRPRFKRQLLGEILLQRQAVDEKQLNIALNIQKNELKSLGETLTSLGFVDEQDVTIALGIQCSLPYIAIEKCHINKNVLSLIPKSFALQHHLMPLDRVGNILSIVVHKPLNDFCVKEIKRITNYQIASFLSTKTAIQQAIDYWYT